MNRNWPSPKDRTRTAADHKRPSYHHSRGLCHVVVLDARVTWSFPGQQDGVPVARVAQHVAAAPEPRQRRHARRVARRGGADGAARARGARLRLAHQRRRRRCGRHRRQRRRRRRHPREGQHGVRRRVSAPPPPGKTESSASDVTWCRTPCV